MHPLLFLQFNLICRVFLKSTLKLNPCSSSISCGMKKETAQTNISCHQRSGCLWRKSSLKTHGLVHITSARERNIYGLSPNFWPLKLKALSPPPFSQLTHRKNVSLYSWEKFLCAQRYSYIDEWSNSALPPKRWDKSTDSQETRVLNCALPTPFYRGRKTRPNWVSKFPVIYSTPGW